MCWNFLPDRSSYSALSPPKKRERMKIELITISRSACALTVLVDRLTSRGRARHCGILGKLSPVFSLPPPPVQMVSNIYSFALFIKHCFGQTPVWLSCNRPTCENSMLQLEMRWTIVISFFSKSRLENVSATTQVAFSR